MFKLRNGIFYLVTLFVFAVGTAVNAEIVTSTSSQSSIRGVTVQQKVTVKTLGQINLKDTKDAISSFEGITANAAQAGLADILLHGEVVTEPYGENAKRVRVTWHTMEKQTLGQSYRQALDTPLRSSIIVKGEDIQAQTTMIATGDLELIITAFNKILEKENNKDGEAVKEEEEDDKENKGLAKDSGRVDTGSAAGGGSPESSDDGLSAETVAEDTTQQTFCGYRSDLDALQMFKQVRVDTVNGETGDVTEGTCADAGDPLPLTKKYGGDCTGTPDLENRVVYQGYRIYGNVDGFTQIVQDCQTDLTENTIAIQNTFSGCGVTHDFVNGESIQQERLYYLSGSGETQVRGCQDSATQKYAHNATAAGCEPVIDLVNGVVFPQLHIGYMDNQGATNYITDCAAAAGGSGLTILDEVCASPKYDHDYANGLSYVLKKQYYVYNAENVYLNACGRSATTYPHLTFTADCGIEYDDANLTTNLLTVTAIDTLDDGQIEIAPCSIDDRISYMYMDYALVETRTYSSSMTRKVRQVEVDIGYSYTMSFGWNDTGNYKAPSGLIPKSPWNGSYSSNNITGTGVYACGGGMAGSTWISNYESYFYWICTATRVERQANKRYQRYDGTFYYELDPSIQDHRWGRY